MPRPADRRRIRGANWQQRRSLGNTVLSSLPLPWPVCPARVIRPKVRSAAHFGNVRFALQVCRFERVANRRGRLLDPKVLTLSPGVVIARRRGHFRDRAQLGDVEGTGRTAALELQLADSLEFDLGADISQYSLRDEDLAGCCRGAKPCCPVDDGANRGIVVTALEPDRPEAGMALIDPDTET